VNLSQKVTGVLQMLHDLACDHAGIAAREQMGEILIQVSHNQRDFALELRLIGN
jgi:hypothetical protein